MSLIYSLDAVKKSNYSTDDKFEFLVDVIKELKKAYSNVQQINVKLSATNKDLLNRITELEEKTKWMEV